MEKHFSDGSFKAEARSLAASHLMGVLYPMVAQGTSLPEKHSKEYIDAQWETLLCYLDIAVRGMHESS
jgi:hypothetical protein